MSSRPLWVIKQDFVSRIKMKKGRKEKGKEKKKKRKEQGRGEGSVDFSETSKMLVLEFYLKTQNHWV